MNELPCVRACACWNVRGDGRKGRMDRLMGEVSGRVGGWMGVRVGGRMDRRKYGPFDQSNRLFRYREDE